MLKDVILKPTDDYLLVDLRSGKTRWTTGKVIALGPGGPYYQDMESGGQRAIVPDDEIVVDGSEAEQITVNEQKLYVLRARDVIALVVKAE